MTSVARPLLSDAPPPNVPAVAGAIALLAGGALGSAFIPTFTGLLARREEDSAWRLASAIASAVTLTLSLLAVILAVFAPQVVRYALAPGHGDVEGEPVFAGGLGSA